MNPVRTRYWGDWSGRRWLSLGVVAVVLSVSAYLLLQKIRDIEAYSEKLLVEATVRNMRTGLLLAQGEAALENKGRDEVLRVGANPVLWLGSPPAGYAGDCPEKRPALAAGAWCFDLQAHELVYRVHYPERLRSRDGGREEMIRWAVVAASKTRDGRVSGLRLEVQSPYVWE